MTLDLAVLLLGTSCWLLWVCVWMRWGRERG
jgi:hypothetical protein